MKERSGGGVGKRAVSLGQTMSVMEDGSKKRKLGKQAVGLEDQDQ